jgi:hypothetical protein
VRGVGSRPGRRYRSIGINEHVLYWPRTWDSRASQEDTVFEHVMSDVTPGLKAGPRWARVLLLFGSLTLVAPLYSRREVAEN